MSISIGELYSSELVAVEHRRAEQYLICAVTIRVGHTHIAHRTFLLQGFCHIRKHLVSQRFHYIKLTRGLHVIVRAME